MTVEDAIQDQAQDAQIERILQGDARTLARTLSQVENRPGAATTELLRRLYPHCGKAFIIGVTGSPGAGKSTLVDGLAQLYRRQELKVAILAVDPTSPFSGGAILGDRVRMQRLSRDSGVFIRSMATRGRMGGLSSAVEEALVVLDAAGFDILIVETVGVGQDEVDIAKAAHATLVVLVPGMGDDIQAVKAGIMEIADVFAVNKADREEAGKTEAELKALLSMSERPDGWTPPVVMTVATSRSGIEELAQALQDYRRHLQQRQETSPRTRHLYRERLLEMLRDRLLHEVLDKIPASRLDEAVEDWMQAKADPYTILDRLLASPTVKEENDD
ncbi:MAG TPA: methylmalonyl Co-A mutase-associated GTPase MeaB [Acidobacteriota bacterium]|nr:methylmalonyl Co-A mutase-associated GTPase MeaB [Acidobacteriota bacterium]